MTAFKTIRKKFQMITRLLPSNAKEKVKEFYLRFISHKSNTRLFRKRKIDVFSENSLIFLPHARNVR